MEESKQIANIENDEKEKLYIKEKFPFFGEEIMKNAKLKKQGIFLISKIDNKKSIIHNLFIDRFGDNFFRKQNILNEYKNMAGKIQEKKVEKDFNKIKKKIVRNIKKENLEEKELKSKINMGNMTYLNLRNIIVSNKQLLNDKLFFLSKNLSVANNEKDVINEYILKEAKKEENDEINENLNNKDIESTNYYLTHNNFSLSQQSFTNPNNYLNLKKYLIDKRRNSESLSKIAQINIETEKININNYPSINSIYSYNYKPNKKAEIKKEISNSNSLLSNSQTNFYSSKMSNFLLPKYNKTFHGGDKTNINSFYLAKNMSNTDINNNMIYNKCKSLSTSETNETKRVNKNHIKRNNSLINLSSRLYNQKKFIKNIYNKTDLLNNLMGKNNNRLVKLIDRNFHIAKKSNSVKEIQKEEEFKLIKIMFDNKNTYKVIRKYKKPDTKIKPILKMSQNDENKINDKKNLLKKFFFEHYKSMEDNMALSFVGELFNTKYIKFQLKEFRDKRREIKKKMDEEKLEKIKRKIVLNNIKIRKMKFSLENKKIKLRKK